MSSFDIYTIMDFKNKMIYTYDLENGLIPLRKLTSSFVPQPQIWDEHNANMKSYIAVQRKVPYSYNGSVGMREDLLRSTMPDYEIHHAFGHSISLRNPTVSPTAYLFDNKVPLDEKFLYALYRHAVCFIDEGTKYYVDKTGLHPSVGPHHKRTDIVGGKVAWFDVTLAEPTTSEKASTCIEDAHLEMI